MKRCQECGHRGEVHVVKKNFIVCMGEALPCPCVKTYFKDDYEKEQLPQHLY